MIPSVKIKELPVKPYSDIQSTDIMLIEDSEDTKQISVEDLKILFSSDEKLNAIIEKLKTTYEELKKYVEDNIDKITSGNEELETKVSNLFEDHERTKQQVGRLREDMTDVQNDISEINTSIGNINKTIQDMQEMLIIHDDKIQDLERDNEINKKDIELLKQDNETNKQNIAKLQEDLKNLTDHVDSEIKRLDDRITQINTENHNYTDKMYDQLMLYIDYYHHVHEFPPNFDEPYKGDPMVARYIHPVGTIFETTDPDFQPNEWFPGTWEFKGTGASITDEDGRVVDYYTYVRLE